MMRGIWQTWLLCKIISPESGFFFFWPPSISLRALIAAVRKQVDICITQFKPVRPYKISQCALFHKFNKICPTTDGSLRRRESSPLTCVSSFSPPTLIVFYKSNCKSLTLFYYDWSWRKLDIEESSAVSEVELLSTKCTWSAAAKIS